MGRQRKLEAARVERVKIVRHWDRPTHLGHPTPRLAYCLLPERIREGRGVTTAVEVPSSYRDGKVITITKEPGATRWRLYE